MAHEIIKIQKINCKKKLAKSEYINDYVKFPKGVRKHSQFAKPHFPKIKFPASPGYKETKDNKK